MGVYEKYYGYGHQEEEESWLVKFWWVVCEICVISWFRCMYLAGTESEKWKNQNFLLLYYNQTVREYMYCYSNGGLAKNVIRWTSTEGKKKNQRLTGWKKLEM